MSLAQKHCISCSAGVEKLTADAHKQLHRDVPGWSVVENRQLSRTYEFPDYAAALAWVNALSAVAEAEGHHPDVQLAWGRVRVDIWTHKINGLSENDFILAARIDALANQPKHS